MRWSARYRVAAGSRQLLQMSGSRRTVSDLLMRISIRHSLVAKETDAGTWPGLRVADRRRSIGTGSGTAFATIRYQTCPGTRQPFGRYPYPRRKSIILRASRTIVAPAHNFIPTVEVGVGPKTMEWLSYEGAGAGCWMSGGVRRGALCRRSSYTYAISQQHPSNYTHCRQSKNAIRRSILRRSPNRNSSVTSKTTF